MAEAKENILLFQFFIEGDEITRGISVRVLETFLKKENFI